MLFSSLTLLVSLGTCLAKPLGASASPNGEEMTFPTRNPNAPAPLFGLEHDTKIPNEYIVMFQPGHTLEQHYEAIGKNFSDSPRFHNLDFLPGYAAPMDDDTLHELVRQDPGVLLVDTNRRVHLIEPTYSSEDFEANETAVSPDNMMVKRDYTQDTQQDAPYGLQMLTSATKLSTPVANGGNYDFVRGAGKGVQAYILDTGIRLTHELLQGRATNLNGLAPTDKSPYLDETMDDNHGHGTHVAGTVGAKQYGVAPYTDLINVKVLGEGASTAGLASAIGDVTKDHNAKKSASNSDVWTFRGSVINMSLGFEGVAWPVVYALVSATDAGIGVFAAAGNENKDASSTYPCSLPTVYCVGAVDNNYVKADFSNYGSYVQYIAPGDDIISLGISSDTALATKRGTSQATPHVTGAAAIFTFWQGLVNHQVGSYVWWNSVSGLTTGFPSSQDNYFVTTGIHSPKKYPKEPFRWAGDWPVKNHQVNNVYTGNVRSETVAPSSTFPASLLLTSFASGFSYTTDAPVSGLYLNSTVGGGSFTISVIPGSSSAAATQSAPAGCSVVAPSATLCS